MSCFDVVCGWKLSWCILLFITYNHGSGDGGNKNVVQTLLYRGTPKKPAFWKRALLDLSFAVGECVSFSFSRFFVLSKQIKNVLLIIFRFHYLWCSIFWDIYFLDKIQNNKEEPATTCCVRQWLGCLFVDVSWLNLLLRNYLVAGLHLSLQIMSNMPRSNKFFCCAFFYNPRRKIQKCFDFTSVCNCFYAFIWRDVIHFRPKYIHVLGN